MKKKFKIPTIKVPKIETSENKTLPVEEKRKENQKSYDNHWRKFSNAFRKKHLFCKQCLKEGVYTYSDLHVDHIIPLVQRPDLKYVESNLQVLCRSCHGKKTYKETLGKEKGQ
ncbi:HNH endonuclease signature motif containing protein [Novacetimonas hansenii]|uniref:HNH nuclease domain-containing protein n=1 Tax=Novacetimonas hansenii TaxID=436 RepID=A0ABQ0SGR2_NOVHA|nr:HNH endonuclease signature motif containing protein [Novacetimonas hansenii]GAN84051.1 hypothetical protein Gaha_0122_051 [Novacetimonas hansenii JCM 7643]GBQ55882.1 hypothetical protein AA0243_1039 [Novacetimonas hansenii NRIC 0243]GEC64576.1 hypothetical protein GHA01_24250 [Novacetimonas hansenii]